MCNSLKPIAKLPGSKSATHATVFVILLATWPSPAAATLSLKLNQGQLVHQAEHIVVAEVVARRSLWLRGRIYTAHEIQISQRWKGQGPLHNVEVLGLGGVAGDVGQRVEGALQLTLGQHAVFYLILHNDGHYYPVAMAQGAHFFSHASSVSLPGQPSHNLGSSGQHHATNLPGLETLRERVVAALRKQNVEGKAAP